jgi:hypothetical protein
VRLEALAQPGGICRMSLGPCGFTEFAMPGPPAGSRSLLASPVLPLPDKPSIALLPLANMSGDPEQDYFADEMVEEIGTRALAGLYWRHPTPPDFYVIAQVVGWINSGKGMRHAT